jgi:hypothetical protein
VRAADEKGKYLPAWRESQVVSRDHTRAPTTAVNHPHGGRAASPGQDMAFARGGTCQIEPFRHKIAMVIEVPPPRRRQKISGFRTPGLPQEPNRVDLFFSIFTMTNKNDHSNCSVIFLLLVL